MINTIAMGALANLTGSYTLSLTGTIGGASTIVFLSKEKKGKLPAGIIGGVAATSLVASLNTGVTDSFTEYSAMRDYLKTASTEEIESIAEKLNNEKINSNVEKAYEKAEETAASDKELARIKDGTLRNSLSDYYGSLKPEEFEEEVSKTLTR